MNVRSTHEVQLRSGLLRIVTHATEIPLEELCGFGSRRSQRRGFVFVSKVLGKHWPVRPQVFQDCCNRLATRLTRWVEPAVIVAMAETATGLGHGIFESWLKQTRRTDLLFLHGTRYNLDTPPILTFEESHSHATKHWLHEPTDTDLRRQFRTPHTLVIVDDEISTGSTIANLAIAYRRLCPDLRQVVCVCLTDWMNAADRAAMTARIGLPTDFVSLLRGEFTFEPNPVFDPGPPVLVTGDGRSKSFCLPSNYGRTGLGAMLALDEAGLVAEANVLPDSRVLILGTGEFQYPAFRLAQWLERRGQDVMFQSTTRSPLLLDRHLTSVLEFTDNYHESIPNFLYNVTDRTYHQVLIGYETDPLPAEHQLCRQLNATPIHFARR